MGHLDDILAFTRIRNHVWVGRIAVGHRSHVGNPFIVNSRLVSSSSASKSGSGLRWGALICPASALARPAPLRSLMDAQRARRCPRVFPVVPLRAREVERDPAAGAVATRPQRVLELCCRRQPAGSRRPGPPPSPGRTNSPGTGGPRPSDSGTQHGQPDGQPDTCFRTGVDVHVGSDRHEPQLVARTGEPGRHHMESVIALAGQDCGRGPGSRPGLSPLAP